MRVRTGRRVPTRLLLGVVAASLAAACSDGGEADAPSGRDPFDLSGTRPPVVLVIVDTLRADRLGCYGCELDTSPNIDAFAEGAYLFDSNTTQCNSTFPSITSIMTGLYVRTHSNYLPVPIAGVTRSNGGDGSMADRLGDEGYWNVGVVSHRAWVDDPSDTAIRRGWDDYSAIPSTLEGEERWAAANAGYTNERAKVLLDRYRDEHADRPLFLWVHYFDPHTPYTPPEHLRDRWVEHHTKQLGVDEWRAELLTVPAEQRYAWIESRTDVPQRKRADLRLALDRAYYDAEVAYTDEKVGELFEELGRTGTFDDAIVVFMADHGENLEDRRTGRRRIAFTHDRLFEPVVHTPLIVKLPHQTEGAVSHALTQNIDVLPTIVDLLDLPDGPKIEGRSLVPLFADPAATLHERVFVESSDNVERALRTTDRKYIEPGPDEPPLLFAWRDDPLELDDLAARAPKKALDEFARTLADFRPNQGLVVDVQPWTQDFDAHFSVRIGSGKFMHVEGADSSELSEGDTVATFSVHVTDAPREVMLLPSEKAKGLAWTVRTTGPAPLQSHLFLGQQPIDRTAVAPLWVADADRPVPEDPVLRLATERREGGADVVRVAIGAGPKVEIEARPALFEYDDDEAQVVEASGLDVIEHDEVAIRRPFELLESDGSTASSATLLFPAKDRAELVLVRLDGAWPHPGVVTLDGSAVRPDVLGFEFPIPGDGRIAAALLAGPPEGGGPPGSITIWTSTSSDRVVIDTGNLDPLLVEELRALGYVR
ncbi:MAG: sulfatase [Planctomycetota bacterium]